MKRPAVLVLPILIALASLGVQPASAQEDVCTGTGNMSTGSGLGELPTQVTTTFSITFTAGTCALGLGFAASGTLTGACGHFTGSGISNFGQRFALTSMGAVVVLTGRVTGVMTVVEDPTDAGSCTTGSARRFVVGAVFTKDPPCPPGYAYVFREQTINGVGVYVETCWPLA
ncbi:MAG TPA: hypothetical protein VM938_08020 [Acidimicrobiales bacterium]|nr:hypothetical protein [Acidimicrobiales bacterium]